MYAYEEIEFVDSMGRSVVLDGRPFGLVAVDGLGDVEAETHMQKSPYMDGEQYVVSDYMPRYITLEVIVRGRDYQEVKSHRRFLSALFNPKNGLGTLKYEGNFEIQAVPETVPKFPDMDGRGIRWQRGFITLVCPNPYWRSPNQESKPLQAYVGNFKLPMTFPFELGTSGSRTALYNDGDSPAPVMIEINGPITNPQIFNRTTGEFIRINRSISEGEKIIIDTESGQKKVVVVNASGIESQAFGYLDAESTLFNLEIGENEIEHVADSGNRHAEVIVRWQNRYVGV